MLKKIFQSFLILIFCLLLIPFFTAASCSKTKNYMGWNINKLEEQLKNKETFVFYYGTDRCKHCLQAKKILKENQKIKNAIQDYKNETKAKFVIYWYSSLHQPSKPARRNFDQKLKDLFKKMNFEKFDELLGSGVPLILFFKQGKNITPKNLWGGKTNVEFVTDFIANLKKLV